MGLLILAASAVARAHDIPNERVDRGIQLSLAPGSLRIDYEVSLSELTLTQDLRRLAAELPHGGAEEWFNLYGQTLGPLNARGFLIELDGEPVVARFEGFELDVKEHPRYTFHYRVALRSSGRLAFKDLNYVSSQGTSRLALNAEGGVKLVDSPAPDLLESVPVVPVWQLSDEEERATREVRVRYLADDRRVAKTLQPLPRQESKPARASVGSGVAPAFGGLGELLDRAPAGWWLTALLATCLGALHAIQPGHGKTLAAAASIAPEARALDPVILAASAGFAHAAVILALALGLWITGASSVAGLHRALTGIAGFAIAAAGFWRLGRWAGGHKGHNHRVNQASGRLGTILVGLAAGIVPCWEAVGILLLAATLGRLPQGILLVLAFSAGTTLALIAAGWAAWRIRAQARPSRYGRLAGFASAASGLAAAGVGLVLFLG